MFIIQRYYVDAIKCVESMRIGVHSHPQKNCVVIL